MRAGRPRSREGRLSHRSCSSRGHAPGCRAAVLSIRQSRPTWCAFVDFLFFSFCFRQAPPLPCRVDHPRVKHPIVNNDEPRMGHEYRWACLAAPPSWDEGPPRERGRPARTRLAKPSPISSTRLDRQPRHDSASAEPKWFPPAGWPVAASQGNGAVRNAIACGRDARAPGGAPLPSLLFLEGACQQVQ